MQDKLEAYLALLQKWNKAYNLTAVRELGAMRTHHLADSLSIQPFVQGDRVLDVGTGAGLPGIPLAIAMPETHFTLLDSNGKKTRFLLQVKSELGLDNVAVVEARMESFKADLFDTIVSRAVADPSILVPNTEHLLAEKGRWLLMVGPSEAAAWQQAGIAQTLHPLKVPGLNATRALLEIKRA